MSTGLLINCALLYKLDQRGLVTDEMKPWIQELGTMLRKLFEDKAKSLSKAREGLTFEPDFPGYLSFTAHDFRVYFPFFILDDLPSDEVVSELIRIAVKIKSCKHSTMCLSGSALYFGTLKSLGDLDYLEYQNSPKLDPPSIQGSDDIRLLENIEDRFAIYLTKTAFYGYIEVTNKIAVIDYGSPGYPTSAESSPFQEAPLLSTPRPLGDPITLGAYLYRLAKDIRQSTLGNPEKLPRGFFHSADSSRTQKQVEWWKRFMESSRTPNF